MGFIINNGVLVSYEEEAGITDITIPDSVMSIADRAFYKCQRITRIIIPEGVTSIGNFAFASCASLRSIVIPKGTTNIGDGAFKDCESLRNIVIPDGVTSIGDAAFHGCGNLKSLVIPEGVTRIGDGAFAVCESLTNIVIPVSVTSIRKNAFYGCKNIASIVIPGGVTSIGDGSFSWCRKLKSVIISKGVTSIENGAFMGCLCLTNVDLPEGLTSIGRDAFWMCESLTSISIPESVNSIGDQAFRKCENLTKLVLPASLKSIGRDVFDGCSKLKEIQNILWLIRSGCEVHTATLKWLLENIWNGVEFLSETAQVYLSGSGKTVNDICEGRLFENCVASADVMLELIKQNKDNSSAMKKLASFALSCSQSLSTEKMNAIYEALQEVGAKPAAKILEKSIQSDGAPTLEGGTGQPVEALCMERYKEAIIDKGLKDYGISPKLFEGVHYKRSETLAPAFVLKCAIFPYMQKLKELPREIGNYQSDFVLVEPDPQVDEIAETLEREDLQELLEGLIIKFDPFKWRLLLPYCRYGSGKQMNALATWAKKWAVWSDYNAAGRRFIIVLQGAMMLNETREAMFLLDKWGFLEEYAKRMNTTADVLRDTVLTEFDLDADGSKRYDLGNAVIAASIMQNLSVTLFNETDGKEVKSLPKRGADPEKYAAASEDFADLKKNIKNAVKSRVGKLKEDFVSGFEMKTSDWKSSYLNNYVLKRVASLLVWQWMQEESTTRFMLTMDGTFIGCDGQPIEISDAGSIVVAHPVEIPAEELECWKNLLTEMQLAQPFVQIFEPINEVEPITAAARYKGMELPMFLLRGLAKEGIQNTGFMYEGGSLEFQGEAITIDASFSGAYFTESSIPFDEIVKLGEVTIKGTPRAVNHEIYAMDKALIENRVRNGDIAAVQAFSRGITARTIQHLIDVSIQAEKMEVTAWLMNYKNDHFPYTFADLEL